MNILILMAGSDKDFCEKGYPKYLIEIKNKPIIQRTIELLKTVGNNITCIIRKEDQDKYFLGDTLKILCPKCKIIEIAGDTKGAVCSALFAIDAIHPQYSSVLLDENNFVIQTSEKRPISNIASTGCCYFKKGQDFVRSAFGVIEKDVDTLGQYYISATFNEMILDNKSIGTYEIPKKDYVTFSNYQMYENYLAHRRG